MTPARTKACIFSAAGRAALRCFVAPETLLAFDLDGTLAPIVSNRSGVLIPDEIQERMSRICCLATVAIVTGRARDDARAHLAFKPKFIVGNHGAEGLPGGEEREKEFTVLCRGWEEQLRSFLPDEESSHILFENKGPTLSLHYRNAPAPEAALRKIAEAVRKLKPPPRTIPGKFVENIVPSDAADKGKAVLLIMQHTGSSRAVFVGDDVTDEDVFRLRNNNILGIKVGYDAFSGAGYYLLGQSEILRLLDEIILFLISPPNLLSLPPLP